MDTLFCLRPTPYGGRGIFAIQPIPKDTLLHTCSSPYASVIYRVFRKEVCGQCFAYSFDAKRNAWNVKFDAQAGSGVWFCGEQCRDTWALEHNIGGLQGAMNVIVDKLAKRMKEKKGPDTPVSLRPQDITMDTLDLAWATAEKNPVKPGSDVEYLDDMELDTARFVMSAIIQRHFEETSAPSPVPESTFSWAALLRLQNNELMHIRSRPHVLDSHIRVYRFLRRALLPVLQEYVATSETVRAIVGRDQGNVFGMWDMATEGESEMLGWSMYVSGSYFNHDCAPNVRKERSGRALCFYSTRDVSIGEELCINYIDIKDHVVERREALLNNWYFECACKRCEIELAAGNQIVV